MESKCRGCEGTAWRETEWPHTFTTPTQIPHIPTALPHATQDLLALRSLTRFGPNRVPSLANLSLPSVDAVEHTLREDGVVSVLAFRVIRRDVVGGLVPALEDDVGALVGVLHVRELVAADLLRPLLPAVGDALDLDGGGLG